MKADGIEEAVAIVMAPHFSKMSVCKYFERVNEALEAEQYDLTLHRVDSWHTHPQYIKGLASRVREVLPAFTGTSQADIHMLFTAHSLPARILEYYGPYPRQLHETCRLLADELNHPKWSFAYQSAGKSRVPWLGPDITEAIKDLEKQGEQNILVCSIGFIADHLEIIFDIDIEAKPEAEQIGVQLERTKTLNDSPYLARTLADIVQKRFDAQ